MRLNELQSKPKDYNDLKHAVLSFSKSENIYNPTEKKINNYMQRYGFSLIGTGMSGLVYKNPNYNYLVKIFFEDPAYWFWVRFCLKNKSNPWLPKFRGSVISIIKNVYALRMEELEYGLKNKQNDYAYAIELLIDNFDAIYFNNEKLDIIEKEVKPHIDYTDPDLIKALLAIKTIIKSGKGDLDIHYQNLMFRGDQAVIIDPVSS